MATLKCTNIANTCCIQTLRGSLTQENILKMQEEYPLTRVLLHTAEFEIQCPTMCMLAERGSIVAATAKTKKIQFDFGQKRKFIFSPKDLALITGFLFENKLPEIQFSSDTEFLNLFRSDEEILFEDIIDILKEQGRINRNSTIVRKCGVLYLLHSLVFAKEKKNTVNFRQLVLVDNPMDFNAFPWGSMLWEGLVEEWSNHTKRAKEAKNKQSGTVQLKFQHFPYAIQAWFLEGLSLILSGTLATRSVDDLFPRILRWQAKHKSMYNSARALIYNESKVHIL